MLLGNFTCQTGPVLVFAISNFWTQSLSYTGKELSKYMFVSHALAETFLISFFVIKLLVLDTISFYSYKGGRGLQAATNTNY